MQGLCGRSPIIEGRPPCRGGPGIESTARPGGCPGADPLTPLSMLYLLQPQHQRGGAALSTFSGIDL